MSASFVSLMYHNVVRDDDAGARADMAGLSPSITSYFISAAAFARQLDAVVRVADVLKYSELERFYWPHSEALERSGEGEAPAEPSHEVSPMSIVAPQERRPPMAPIQRTENHSQRNSDAATRPLVQLTFDDGWRGSVDVAGPLLAERRLQTLLFVTTGLLGTPRFLAESELARLPRETFHVGSHTVSHRFLSELPDAEIRDELRRSKQELEDIVGYEVDALSVPNGASDARVVRIAGECGYRFVCVSDVHRNSRRRGPLAIGRTAIRATTSTETVVRHARGDLRREALRSALLSLPKLTLGPARYRRLRGALLGQQAHEQEMCDLTAAHPAPA